MEAKRKLLKVDISFISLVDKGANKRRIIYKSDNPSDTYQKEIEIIKVDGEQRLVYGIVYAPEDVDTQGDFTSAEVIKEMAHQFMKEAKTNNVDKQHNYVSGEGYVAENRSV